eukprot:9470253-Pyramimonas_sp.AAC.1
MPQDGPQDDDDDDDDDDGGGHGDGDGDGGAQRARIGTLGESRGAREAGQRRPTRGRAVRTELLLHELL